MKPGINAEGVSIASLQGQSHTIAIGFTLMKKELLSSALRVG